MSTYALHTMTMLESTTKPSLSLLGQATKREASKSALPSKRKRDDICGLGSFNKPFTIRPYPEAPHEKPAIFKPLRIIGRSQLPLNFLNTAPDDNFVANRVFSAQIDILEREPGSGKDTRGPKVLIARYDSKKTLYAIERMQPRLYSICRLADWLKEKEVAELWDPSTIASFDVPLRADTRASSELSGQWWQHAMVETQNVERPVQRPRMTMKRHKAQNEATSTQSEINESIKSETTPQVQEPVAIEPQSEPVDGAPSPKEQLEAFLQQYLDAVYLSKTSLAYFAKGPVTRIRNTFTSPDEGAPQTFELVTFLRSMLLSPKAGEKKYYDKLPSIIKAFPPGSFSEDETVAGQDKAKKRKRKMKLGRDGLYPEEESVIRKWWRSSSSNGENIGPETIEQRIKRRVGDLRVRETLAQLIIMLEIVALEALSTFKPPSEEKVAGDGTNEDAELQPKAGKKKSKLDDIRVQLDLLLDRLSIWHATEEMGILDFEAKGSKQTDDLDESGKSKSSDRLHSFCVEVIIPFYINRLPEQALMVNKKLGGPAHSSPPKRKAMKPPTTSRKSGEPKEPDSKKSRRSLARVATDTNGKTISRKTPSLNRSATDSILLDGIKREGSEVPLSAIPFQRSPSKSARSSMSQMRHLQGREIDLTRPSAAAEAKLKQKQRVEEDLKAAISALKKPNRDLAAGSYVADIERRGLGVNNRSRKPTNTVRKIVKDVQVQATPRVGRRTRDVMQQTPSRHQYNSLPSTFMAFAPQQDEFSIPSTGAHPPSAVVPTTVLRSTTGRSLAYPNIAETPSKAPNTKSFSSGSVRRSIFATPSKIENTPKNAHTSHVFATPAKPFRSLSQPEQSSPPAAIAATPTKDTLESRGQVEPLTFSQPAQDDGGSSIYDALGWNDDDDDM